MAGASTGPITASGLYAGEDHDARLALVDAGGRGFSEAGYDVRGLGPGRRAEAIVAPEARVSPFVRRLEELPVREVITTPSGQDGARLRAEPRRPAAHPRRRPGRHDVTLRHAEVLEDGELGIRPLRARRGDRHATRSRGDGRRGVGAALHVPRLPLRRGRRAGPASSTRPTSPRSCCTATWSAPAGSRRSDPLVNRLHENVVWGMRGNFLYVPTDCPQRDERLGWTGDIQVFAPTASFLYDVRGLPRLVAARPRARAGSADGVVPFVVPERARRCAAAARAAWGDAATVVPWVLYERYGDVGDRSSGSTRA